MITLISETTSDEIIPRTTSSIKPTPKPIPFFHIEIPIAGELFISGMIIALAADPDPDLSEFDAVLPASADAVF